MRIIYNPLLPDGFQYVQSSSGSGSGAFNTPVVQFRQEFVGDGSTTQFQLTSSINNASFIQGSWDVNQIELLKPATPAKDNGGRIYDSIIPIYKDLISVQSITAGGLVTLDHAPISGATFYIYYYYHLKTVDIIDDYFFTVVINEASDVGSVNLEEAKRYAYFIS